MDGCFPALDSPHSELCAGGGRFVGYPLRKGGGEPEGTEAPQLGGRGGRSEGGAKPLV